MLHVSRRPLKNDLTVVYLHLPHVHASSLAFTARGGPRYEAVTNNGLSHVMEHLLFRGTRAHPDSLSFHSAIEHLGGEINGQTQRDAVTAHVTVPPRATEAAAALLAEVCIEPLMRGLEIEREVILEEILDTRDGDGRELDIDTLSRNVLWPDHPMGMSITGPVENLERFTEAQAARWHAKTFVARNSTLVIAGPCSPDRLHPRIEAAFGAMPSGRRLREPRAPRAPKWSPVHVQPTEDAQVTALLTFPAPHEKHPDYAALQLLQRVLDDGFGSRLRQAICEQRGLAYALAVSMDAYADCAAIDIELTCAPEKLVAAVAQTLAVLEQTRRGPVPRPELERAKNRHEAALEFCLDDPSELSSWVAGCELMGVGESYHDRLAEVLAVTPDEITALARTIFSPERGVLTLVGPVERKQAAQLTRLLARRPGSTVWWNERPAAPVLEIAG